MEGAFGGMEKDGLTLTGFLLNHQQFVQEATGDFTILMSSIQLACKAISTAVRKAGILGMYGLEGSVNVQGEEVKKLDILSHDNFVSALKYSTKVGVMVSEEVEDVIIVNGSNGKYCAVFDPLDGSSNIDCNVSVGSIFGIYKRDVDEEPSVKDVLQPGTELVAAGYCMYGSSTQMVLTFGEGVHVFTHDPSVGEFILTNKDVKIPENPKTIYSVNEGNSKYWYPAVSNFVDRVKTADKPYSARYVGSMVSDLHRTLLYGGIFLYPADKKSKNGKLRLLYEANPMSMIVEQAGGKSTTGFERVLDIVPDSIHQRTPIFIGCTRDVDMLLEEFDKHPEQE
mmetsp:Transcript_2283/g.7048  ORF Transcript_2283/g.7048 Transcript_2283/m.7048 type:complete len:339 (+) Transcript_2283:152-1168(+)